MSDEISGSSDILPGYHMILIVSLANICADVTIKDNKGRSCLESAFEHEIPVQLILLLTRRRYALCIQILLIL